MVSTVHYASSHDQWNTPEVVLAPVRLFAGEGGIRLDPCSNADSIVGARESFSLENGKDGLRESWWGRDPGVVYVNPPYGRAVPDWMAKADDEAATGVDDIFALIAARTDTIWFHEFVAKAGAICFWRGRIRFLGAPEQAPFPSAMVYWGTHRYRFADIFSAVGKVVLP